MTEETTTSTPLKNETPKYQPYYKAAELPKELTQMFGPLQCKLCDVHVGSNLTAKAHYQGKTHMKKIKTYLVTWCKNTGNPMPELPKVQRAESNLQKDRCPICDVNFNSPADAEIHFSGKNHMKRLKNPNLPAKKRKIVHITDDTTGRFGIGLSFAPQEVNTSESKVKSKFYCDVCNVQAIDENQLKQHLNGARHFKAVRAKSSTLPVPANPADSILASVCRGNDHGASDYSMHRTPTGYYYCQSCNSTMNSEEQFIQHIESKKHKSKLASRKPQDNIVKDT